LSRQPSYWVVNGPTKLEKGFASNKEMIGELPGLGNAYRQEEKVRRGES